MQNEAMCWPMALVGGDCALGCAAASARATHHSYLITQGCISGYTGQFAKPEKEQLMSTSSQAHVALDLSRLSRVGYIVRVSDAVAHPAVRMLTIW